MRTPFHVALSADFSIVSPIDLFSWLLRSLNVSQSLTGSEYCIALLATIIPTVDIPIYFVLYQLCNNIE